MPGKSSFEMRENVEDGVISVWMVNYNSSAFVAECLVTLLDPSIGRIAILDNGSQPNDLICLRALEHKDPRVVVYESTTNVGFGSGINMISRLEKGWKNEYIWILNPDTRVVLGNPAELASLLERTDYQIVSPTITTGPLNDMKVWFAGGTYDVANGTCSHTGFGSSLSSAVVDHYATQFMTGAAPLMRTKTWELLGGFSESLFLYWEDVDLSLRAHDLGLKMGVCSSVVVWHHEGGSGGISEGHSSAYYYYMNRNRVVVCTPRSSIFSVVVSRGARETVRLLLQPLSITQPNRLAKFVSAFHGLSSGILVSIFGPLRSLRGHTSA